MRFASGRPPGARAARRVLLAVASAALAAGVMAGTASTATASLTGPATSTAEPPPGAPPFFAGIISDNGPNGKFVDVVKIFSSATGAPAATVTVPASPLLFGLARLGDDQHFVVASSDRDTCVSHLWTFAIDAAGQPGPVTPFAVPQVSGGIQEMTSNADGTALAFDVAACKPGHLQTWFIHLSAASTQAQITRWDTPGGTASLSLTADGSVLGFTLDPDDDDPATGPGAWTMPTDVPAGPLLSHAHQVPGLGANAERTALSPDGGQLWIESQNPPIGGQDPVTLTLVTTSTGALVRQVTQLSPGGRDLVFPVLALDTPGQHLLAYGAPDGPGFAGLQEIDLSTGKDVTFTISDPVIDGPLTTFAW